VDLTLFLSEQVGVALGIAGETVIEKQFKVWKSSFIVQGHIVRNPS
jgi:hypothetical protein